MRALPLFVGLAPLLLASRLGFAFELLDGDIQIHGFASQAIVQTTDNQYYGDSEHTSTELTELGINASYQATPSLLLSGQLLSRRAGDLYDGTPSLDYGLLDYTIASTAHHRLGARIGRIKSPLGLYNETRDVPFTRPGIFLPQVIYYDKVRNLLLSYDGVMLYADLYGSKGNLSFELGTGRSVIDENVTWVFLGTDQFGDLEPEGINWGIGSAWYSTPTEALKLGISGVVTEMTFDPKQFSPLSPGTIDVFHWIASLQYNVADWTLSAEYSQTPISWNDLGPVFPFDDQVMEGYYLQGAYRLRPNLEIMARYEEGFQDRNDRSGRDHAALTGGLDPRFAFFSKIFSLGLRWDITPRAMLRFEVQHHDGTFALSWRDNFERSDLVREWDAFAASISVRF